VRRRQGELPAKLRVERIDPKVETLRYTEKILEQGQDQSEEAKS
jgi:arsenite-transporting ATPase